MSITDKKINDYIKNNYHNNTVTQLAKDLNLSRGTVTRRAKKMGLEKEITYKSKGERISFLDYPLDSYFITEFGEVVNSKTGKTLKHKIDDVGYPAVVFQVDNIRYDRRIHRLLSLAFIENEDNKPHVNHIDGDKKNFNLCNLEWCTPKENARHASKTGLLKVGEEHHMSKITEDEAREIKELALKNLKLSEIKEIIPNATKSIVEKIKSGTRWKHL